MSISDRIKKLAAGTVFISLIMIGSALATPPTPAAQPEATQPEAAPAAPAKTADATAEEQDAFVASLRNVITKGPYDAYRNKILGRFTENKFDELDLYFNSLQDAYAAGKISDKELAYAYEPLAKLDDDGYAPYFSGWIKKSPNSYPANALLTSYKISLAWKARGEKWAKDTQDKQFKAFSLLLRDAMASNDKAMTLTGKPILSLRDKLVMLRAGSSFGYSRDQTVRKASDTLVQAIAMDPNNFLPRYNYMVIMQPRWGGSLREMHAFSKKTRAENAPKPVADYLDGFIHFEAGEAFYRAQDYRRAQTHLYKAAQLQAPYYDYGNVDALKRYIDNAYRLSWKENNTDPNTKEFLTMLDMLLREGRRIENPGWYYGERAQVRWNLNHDGRGAWQDYTAGAAYNDPHSLYNIARAYCYGNPEVSEIVMDRATCMTSMVKAAEAGSKLAEKEVEQLAQAQQQKKKSSILGALFGK